MPTYNSHREHLIHALELLLFQLHVLSHLIAPSLLLLLPRALIQLQLARPRDLDPTRPFHFWCIIVIVINAVGIWGHATNGGGPVDGKSVVLDLIGIANTPSKPHVLVLDVTIVVLQIMLVFIAYESAILRDFPPSTTSAPVTNTNSDVGPNISRYPPKPPQASVYPPYIIDLSFSDFISRIRVPTPAPSTGADHALSLPTTATGLPQGGISGTIRALLIAREAQRRAVARARNAETGE